jgi:hypothetical protein
MDGLAHEIHADAGTDRRDVVGPEGGDDRFERVYNVVSADDDLGVFAADIVRDLLGVLEVSGVD